MSITINRPPEQVYAFWRDFARLPRFMSHLRSVDVLDPRRSRWRANVPDGKTLEWDVEIYEDALSERIAWRSLKGADVESRGTVRFLRAPGGHGTEVHVDLQYDRNGGKLGKLLAKAFGGNGDRQLYDDLRRFKQVLETGEVLRSDASIHEGRHPARPPEAAPELPAWALRTAEPLTEPPAQPPAEAQRARLAASTPSKPRPRRGGPTEASR